DGVVDTWADAPRPEAKAEARTAPAEDAPVPLRRDPDDPGPPRLVRGGVADPARNRAGEVPAGTAAAGAAAPRERAEAPAGEPLPTLARRTVDEALPERIPEAPVDDHIRRASAAALEFPEGLPPYVCQQVITRSQRETRPPSWHA